MPRGPGSLCWGWATPPWPSPRWPTPRRCRRSSRSTRQVSVAPGPGIGPLAVRLGPPLLVVAPQGAPPGPLPRRSNLPRGARGWGRAREGGDLRPPCGRGRQTHWARLLAVAGLSEPSPSSRSVRSWWWSPTQSRWWSNPTIALTRGHPWGGGEASRGAAAKGPCSAVACRGQGGLLLSRPLLRLASSPLLLSSPLVPARRGGTAPPLPLVCAGADDTDLPLRLLDNFAIVAEEATSSMQPLESVKQRVLLARGQVLQPDTRFTTGGCRLGRGSKATSGARLQLGGLWG